MFENENEKSLSTFEQCTNLTKMRMRNYNGYKKAWN